MAAKGSIGRPAQRGRRAKFFGFGGIASSAAGIVKVLLVLFVIGFIVSLFFGWRRRP